MVCRADFGCRARRGAGRVCRSSSSRRHGAPAVLGLSGYRVRARGDEWRRSAGSCDRWLACRSGMPAPLRSRRAARLFREGGTALLSLPDPATVSSQERPSATANLSPRTGTYARWRPATRS